jgi:hypothetical protein
MAILMAFSTMPALNAIAGNHWYIATDYQPENKGYITRHRPFIGNGVVINCCSASR